ncbi:hypothetical protein VF13_37015 [Nostoc linckia z16]|nr:hypothetical protein VF13_37015 [Nostoc linckia z16]
MDLEEIILELKIIGERLHLKVEKIDCYIFGSVLINSKLANDIDILIIYKDLGDLSILKGEMKAIELHYPLHFSYFTFSEERELEFIQEQKVIKIFTL